MILAFLSIQQHIVGSLHFPFIYGSVNSISGIKRFQSHRKKIWKVNSPKNYGLSSKDLLLSQFCTLHIKKMHLNHYFSLRITNRGKHAISRKVTMATRHVDNFFSEVNKCSENHDSSFISRLHRLI